MTKNNHVYDMIIIGGGPAGDTAALYAARAGLDTNDVPALQNFAENLEGKDFDALRGNMKFQEIQNSLR